MSDYVHYRGVLELVPTPDGIEVEAQRILTECGDSFNVGEALEFLRDLYYDSYVIVGSNLYKVIRSEECDPYGDIFNASVNTDGTINFEVRYYNGGCGFSEALEHAVERMVQSD